MSDLPKKLELSLACSTTENLNLRAASYAAVSQEAQSGTFDNFLHRHNHQRIKHG